jgi:hypothetical protein
VDGVLDQGIGKPAYPVGTGGYAGGGAVDEDAAAAEAKPLE